MDKQQEAFYRELLADFKIEAAEHMALFTKNLIRTEQEGDGDRHAMTEVMFREMHSLKGAARAVNLKEIETLCQATENVMAQIKTDKLSINENIIDAFHEVLNLLQQFLENIGQKATDELSHILNEQVNTLNSLALGGVKPAKKKRASVKDLASMMGKAKVHRGQGESSGKDEEKRQDKSHEKQTVEEKNKAPYDVEDTKPSSTGPAIKKKDETVRISTKRLEIILRQAEELIIAKAMLQDEVKKINELRELQLSQSKQAEKISQQLIAKLEGGSATLFEDYFRDRKQHAANTQRHLRELLSGSQFKCNNISRMVDDLLIDIRGTLLVPFSSLTDMLPKTVRDLSRSLGKSVNINVEGYNIEIDRRILEEIKDPIIHLVRNCLDHGIEAEQERQKKLKPATSVIELIISQTENREVVIKIKDDGAGIDPKSVVASAVKNHVITEDMAEKMTHSEKLNLIFRSGVSTSKKVTTLSGRGLGMAIVAEKVESLGGKINITSELNKGTTFTMILPLSLTTFRGVMVRCSDQHFMISTTAIERVMRFEQDDIRMVNDRESIVVDGESIGLVSLGAALQVEKPNVNHGIIPHLSVLLLNVAHKRLAFVVDEILGEHEGIVKELGPMLRNVKHISGATVLGNGNVVPVINTAYMLSSEEGSRYVYQKTDVEIKDESRQKRILIAEDSLTSRSLLRNILEVANYKVKTAIDGAQAYQFLSKESFDMLVSDIEMPNLNGLDLVKKVRETENMKSLPVVLISSLGTDQDKQRGLEAGADAYFIKSSFDQTNLIDIVKQLI